MTCRARRVGVGLEYLVGSSWWEREREMEILELSWVGLVSFERLASKKIMTRRRSLLGEWGASTIQSRRREREEASTTRRRRKTPKSGKKKLAL